MNKPASIHVELSDTLSDFVATNIGDDGLYLDAGDYVRDLIRRDLERVEQEKFETLKAELQRAFAAPDSAYKPLDREEFLARARERWQA